MRVRRLLDGVAAVGVILCTNPSRAIVQEGKKNQGEKGGRGEMAALWYRYRGCYDHYYFGESVLERIEFRVI